MTSGTLVIEIDTGVVTPEEAFYQAADAILSELGLDVEKAVAPHHSQFQGRGAGGKFQKHSGTSANLLPAKERLAARKRAYEIQSKQLRPRLHVHLGDRMSGKINSDEWYKRTAADIRYFYGELYRCGRAAAGNPAISMTPQDNAIVNRLVEDELHYLKGFRDHIESGGGKMPYPERIDLYAAAAWESFWNGFASGNRDPGREVRWRFGPTQEHCGIAAGGHETGCSDFEARGWTPIRDFVRDVLSKGYAPRSGMLECTGVRCLCWIEERSGGKVAEQEHPYEDEQPLPENPVPVVGEGMKAEEPADQSGDVAGPVKPKPKAAEPKLPGHSGAEKPTIPAVSGLGKFDAGGAQDLTNQIEGGGQETAEVPKRGGNAADLSIVAAVIGLFWLAENRREDVLRDAVAFLYLNDAQRVAAAGDAAATSRVATIRRSAEKWIQARHLLSSRDAGRVMEKAATVHAYRADGRNVVWESLRWTEPHMEEYPDLKARYSKVTAVDR